MNNLSIDNRARRSASADRRQVIKAIMALPVAIGSALAFRMQKAAAQTPRCDTIAVDDCIIQSIDDMGAAFVKCLVTAATTAVISKDPRAATAGGVVCASLAAADQLRKERGECKRKGCPMGSECTPDGDIHDQKAGLCCPPESNAVSGQCAGACSKCQYWDGFQCKGCDVTKCQWCTFDICGNVDAAWNMWYPVEGCRCCQVGYKCCAGIPYCCPPDRDCRPGGGGCIAKKKK
jgi:hypothetical protein